MDSTQDRNDPEQKALDYRRFRAALELRTLSVESLARQARVSSRHIWYVVTGRRRGSAALLRTIREALGEAGWAFATGSVDVLSDEGKAHA